MRKLLWLTALSLVACDLIAQATATIVVGGLVAATPELRYMGYFDVTSQVTANVWVGERASGTSTEAPTPVSGADVALAFGGKSVQLTESSAERGVYATTSVDDAALSYEAGSTYAFDVTLAELHGGETTAPRRLDAASIGLAPALGSGSPLAGLSTHAANTALSVSWSAEFGKYGLVTVFRADPAKPAQPQLVFDNRPKTAQDMLDLVLGTPPTSIEVPATTFAQPGLYGLILVTADRGEPRDNTSLASPLLVGSGAAVLFTVGTP